MCIHTYKIKYNKIHSVKQHWFLCCSLLSSLSSVAVFNFFVFKDRISVCSPSWPRTLYIDQSSLKLRDLLPLLDSVLGLKVHTVTPGLKSTFLLMIFIFLVFSWGYIVLFKLMITVSIQKRTCAPIPSQDHVLYVLWVRNKYETQIIPKSSYTFATKQLVTD